MFMSVSWFRKLLNQPYVDSVDWSKWHVFWVDERVVPKDHDDSNYKLAYDAFLSKVTLTLTQQACFQVWSSVISLSMVDLVLFG